MLEIVFDEGKDALFMGQSCKMQKLETEANPTWTQARSFAQKIIENNAEERGLKVQFDKENNIPLFSLAFCVEAYDEKTKLETLVIEVSNSKEMIAVFAPYAALNNAVRYMRDLYHMEEKEAYADIKRLGYLGLQVKEDYIKKQITVKWQAREKLKYYSAQTTNAAFVLVGLFKFWAITKADTSYIGIIGNTAEEGEIIPNLKSENEMIEYVINHTVRKNAN